MRISRVRPFAHAFTMIELVVVISVIALLLALTIPAVQSSTEAARKAHCSANLRQLGIAMNAYASTVGGLPTVSNGKNGFSAISMVLPYLDQKQLFNSINFSVFFLEEHNGTASRITISTLLCPTDKGKSGPIACTNDACNCGYGYQLYRNYNGAFSKNPTNLVSIASISDGTTNTALMAEWVIGPASNATRDRLGSAFVAARMPKREQFSQFISACSKHAFEAQRFVNRKGKNWLMASQGTSAYSHNILPNGYSCLNGSGIIDGAWTAGSHHGVGANVVFVDGHIKFVSNSIDISIWRTIATRSGAEIIEPEK